MVRTHGASFNSRGESSRGESSAQGETRRRPTSSTHRSRAAPIEDDPYAEERAFEEQTYEAYETHGQEDAFEALDDDDNEEEHADVHDIQEYVGGFPRGPRDGSLLTHYVQHVAYAISQGRDLEFEEARTALVQLLGVDGGTVGAEMEDARGPKVKLSWLREIYVQRDVHACGRYAWGVAALAHLYEQLGDASSRLHKADGRIFDSISGTSWIYEHFPCMGRRRLVTSYDDTTPRAMRWQSPRQGSTLAEIRSQLDALTYSGVMDSDWGHPLPHLPKRVLRQFGFQQDSPRSPIAVPDADIVAIDHVWLHFRAHIVSNVRHAASPSDCVDGYIQWFRRVSHPYTRLHRRPYPPSPSGALARFRRMARMLQSLISCRHVTEGTVAHQVSVDLLQIANEGIDEYSPTRRGQRHMIQYLYV
ncbi:protein MAINTENANCE OF MERISTEMS-like [Vigna angularis]|uniref:protein MAINTENANCE OF MERISTEMS-like n=1 Tax=Phaseolus angularis TaxID=3914 RepID=UPI0022B3D116|nr:protein MAINTENANCE OF MERISTEMS-like [Vigna angularis]